MTDVELTDLAGTDGLEALRAIAGAAQAWSPWEEVAKNRKGVVERLEAEGLVMIQRWGRPDYLAVTLTPFAAEAMGLTLVERGGDRQIPCWASKSYAEFLTRPVKCERHPRMVPLMFPELIPDHRDPEPLIDEFTEEPVVLFQGPKAGEGLRPNGIPVWREKHKGGRGRKRRMTK